MKKSQQNPLKSPTAGPALQPYPTLSARELEVWTKGLNPHVIGARVERVFVPGCASHPDGYYKKEWAWELHHPSNGNTQFYFCVRSGECGFFVLPPKTLKPASGATRSGFDLSLGKAAEGRKIAAFEAVKNERALCVRFSPVGDETAELYLMLIPSQPEAVLMLNGRLAGSTKVRENFTLPVARKLDETALAKIPMRMDRVEPAPSCGELWFKLRESNALELRKRKLQAQLAMEIDSVTRKISSLREQLDQTREEPDWNQFGSLLQTHFHASPRAEKNAEDKLVYRVEDYKSEKQVELPADPKLGLKQQLERYFHLAKRKRARLQDSETRIESLEARLPDLRTKVASLAQVSTLEELLALAPEIKSAPTLTKSADQKKIAEFSGRTYISKEGLTIVSGRNLKENLEVTFKIARGNDIWLHVKGRPGAHTVILLPPKKTASLETLLDAAHLCILYSGGKDWGKTEVDYTQRKFVKKIKNQTEVSYTNNKTLVVTTDPERAKRLSGS
ncbi:MAG: DUF814 domain-containing protein [Bdellovibrionales bacterium]|nr:DUF814 domain-containing protein [Bdellovibrionales bacterium]